MARICKEFLGPDWAELDDADVAVVTVEGGLTNRLFKCTHPSPTSVPNVVLVRLYNGAFGGESCEIVVRLSAPFRGRRSRVDMRQYSRVYSLVCVQVAHLIMRCSRRPRRIVPSRNGRHDIQHPRRAWHRTGVVRRRCRCWADRGLD